MRVCIHMHMHNGALRPARSRRACMCMSTRTCMCCDLHGLDSTLTPLSKLDSAVAELHKWSAHTDAVTLTCRWHRAAGRLATALTLLSESWSKAKKPASKEELELKHELLDGLGWAHWAAAGRSVLHHTFPTAYPLVYKALE